MLEVTLGSLWAQGRVGGGSWWGPPLSVKDLEAFGGRWDSLQVLEQKITLI